jgi:leucyl/phenylalanyl-tRNA--protein transferase
MRLAWVEPGEPLPEPERALREPNGLLAAGRDLDADRLLEAYAHGIFPWFSRGQPVLWWSPDPRMVLFLDEFRITRSLRRTIRQRAERPQGRASPSPPPEGVKEAWGGPALPSERPQGRASPSPPPVGVKEASGRTELPSERPGWRISTDEAFERVMRECAAPRPDQDGTWIGEAIVAAYTALHRRGHAHSVELWHEDRLVGGLYGVAIGRMFYGESMFTRVPDASKMALAALVQGLLRAGFTVIDCQQNTAHLASLGAREIRRKDFLETVARLTALPAPAWDETRIQFPVA